jgi:hypothetical protein
MPLDTGYLFRQGASGQTKTVTSQRNRIYSPHVGQTGLRIIGVLGDFKVNETRKIDTVRGIGFGDQVAELIPGNTEATKITVTRTALYLQNLMQTFGYKAGSSGLARSLRHHKWPFDIRQEIVFSEISSEASDIGQAQTWTPENPEGGLNSMGDPGDIRAVFTIFEGCWMESYDYTFNNENIVVTENCGIQVSDVFDGNDSVYGMFIDSGNNKSDATGRSMRFAGQN